MALTAADMLVLSMLLWDFRIALGGQLVRAYRAGGVGNPGGGRRRVRELVASGLLGYEDVLARPLLDISRPLYEWPGQGRPDYGILPRLAWQLERRWQQPLSAARVYFASRKAINIFGGVTRGVIKHHGQISHDLHVTEAALNYLEREPGRMGSFVSEDACTAHEPFRKVPDAMFYDLHEEPPRPVLAVEVGGFYPEAKLRAFFEDMELRKLPFVVF
jgi:hypothetical protein